MANARTAADKIAGSRHIEDLAPGNINVFGYLILFMFMITAVSIFHVWSRVQVVDANLKLMSLKNQLKDAEQEQGQLRLEVASLKVPARIESIAKGELGMSLPTEQQIIQVK
ncbi:MAG: cell division protein FtsL [Desulfuromonadales bacterium]|nr:cell division protein FtsL [Desulfuromonadales bacterium]